MILPIGHERTRVARLPYVSFAIVALNAVFFLFTYLREPPRHDAGFVGARNEVLEYLATHPYLDLPVAFEKEFFDDDERRQLHAELEAMRRLPDAPRPPAAEELAQEQAALDARCQRALQALARVQDNYGRRLGFVPAERRPITLFTHMFTHADWGHLLGNMLFLYLTAPFLEDVFGRILFPVFYLASGIAAAYVEAAHGPGSTVPLIGASGAIAGLMGAFLVRFGRTRIRFAYIFGFGILRFLRGTFWAPAFLVLPFWLLQQFLFAAALGQSAGVAFWAHIGGFLFGSAVTLLLRVGRVEERWIAPRIHSSTVLERHAGLTKGMEARSAGRLPAARGHLEEALRAAPDDPDVHLELFRTLAATGDAMAAGRHALRHVELELRAGNAGSALATFLEAADLDPPPPWSAGTLLSISRAAEKGGDERCALETYALLALRHPQDPIAAKGLAAAAAIRVRRNDVREAVELLRRALHVPRLDPDLAREIETRLRSVADAAGLPVPAFPRVAERGLTPPVATPPRPRRDRSGE